MLFNYLFISSNISFSVEIFTESEVSTSLLKANPKMFSESTDRNIRVSSTVGDPVYHKYPNLPDINIFRVKFAAKKSTLPGKLWRATSTVE